MPDDYDFLCVDGGVIDNEPLELARRVLLGEHAKGKVGPEDADHALMMVDPFPSAVTFPVEYRAHHVGSSRDFSLARLALAFIQCLMNQARFKPEELEQAVAPANCSRYLLEPIRYDPDTGEQQQYAIACGSVDGFGGFLSEAFRRHDYQLGRRNCQQFLRKHFVLSERHPLFQGTCPPAALARYAVYRSLGGREVWTYPHQGKEGECYLPIIPLVDDALENEVPTPTWPRLGLVELEAHREPLRQRLHRLGDRLIEEQQLKISKWPSIRSWTMSLTI